MTIDYIYTNYLSINIVLKEPINGIKEVILSFDNTQNMLDYLDKLMREN